MARPGSLVAGRLRAHAAGALLAALLLGAGLVAFPAPSGADAAPPEPGSAAELLDRAFRNLYAEDYIQTLVLATQSRGGREMRRRLQLTRRQSVRPGKALLRFLYPQTIRRTSVLILENSARSDDLYVYLPATRITRHLSNAQKADSFFGTDLSYEDVEPKSIDDFVVRWLEPGEAPAESQEREGESDCVRVEITAAPDFESAYEKQVSCLERERGIILWTDYYVAGRHLKRLAIDPKEVRRVGDRHIPFLITIETPRQRSKTKVITEDYDLRAEIPDKIFNTWNLQAGDAKSDRQKATPAPGPAPGPPVVHEGE
jgi:hypothetical protein